MLLEGATLLGVILSSDKTNIPVMTGDCVAHPVLLNLVNIHADVHMKSSNHAFLLVALLPCPKFIARDRGVCGILKNCVNHLCLNIITHPLKLAACAGQMMSDPHGYSHFCFTFLASYMVDTPKATMLVLLERPRISPWPTTTSSVTPFDRNRAQHQQPSHNLLQLQRHFIPWTSQFIFLLQKPAGSTASISLFGVTGFLNRVLGTHHEYLLQNPLDFSPPSLSTIGINNLGPQYEVVNLYCWRR